MFSAVYFLLAYTSEEIIVSGVVEDDCIGIVHGIKRGVITNDTTNEASESTYIHRGPTFGNGGDVQNLAAIRT